MSVGLLLLSESIHQTLEASTDNLFMDVMEKNHFLRKFESHKFNSAYPLASFPDFMASSIQDIIDNNFVSSSIELLEQVSTDQAETIFAIRESLADWNSLEPALLREKLTQIFKSLGRPCLITLMRMSKTRLSSDKFPIHYCDLIEAASRFEGKCVKSQLTICGKAFTKHVIRDTSLMFWGECKGSNETKNQMALVNLLKILDNCVWINVHKLPHQVEVLEIRVKEGYGVRFDYEPLRFRGFIEPQQVEGWKNRFKH